MKKLILTSLILTALTASALTACGEVEEAELSSALEIVVDATDSTEESTDEATTEIAQETTEEEETKAEWTEDNTEETTEAATEALTEATTEALTEAPTEAPTDAPTQAPTEAPAGSFEYDDMVFVYGNTQATVLADAAGLVAALGAPDYTEEAQSCLSNGNDVKIYYYNNGINVYTYIEDGREIIYEIELTSASYSTHKGLAPGMTLADAERLYGKNYTYSGGVVSYYSTDSTYMYLYMSGDKIASIGYAAEV